MGLNWTYNGKDFTEDLVGNNYGFVYQITNLTNGRKYIGKKFFYSAKTKQVKGKKLQAIGKLTMGVVTI